MAKTLAIDLVLEEAERKREHAEAEIALRELAGKLMRDKIRVEALSQVAAFTEKCIGAAREAVRKGGEVRSVEVCIKDSGEKWTRDCYLDAVTEVATNLMNQGFRVTVTKTQNHGRHNAESHHEYHYEIGVHLEW